MNSYIIYKLIFPNGKLYIGQTCEEFDYYMNKYKTNAQNKKRKDYNRPVNKAIRKYGWDNVKKEILYTVSEKFVDELETKMIAEYKSADREFGYNLESGGNRNKHLSEITKKKISKTKKEKELHKGKNNPMFGKIHSKESIEKMRKIKLGKKLSKETRQKISKVKKGKKQSKEHIENVSIAKQKSVIVVNKITGQEIKFESSKQASIELNISRSHICNLLKTKYINKNYNFKYYDT